MRRLWVRFPPSAPIIPEYRSIFGVYCTFEAVSAFAIIACNETADEEMVYKLTRVIWEHYDEACASCKDIGSWMHKEDIPSITNAMGLHPGAERYYKEIGLL